MFCPECGTKLNDDAKFCFNCGAKVAVKQVLNEKDKLNRGFSVNESAYVEYMKNKVLNAYISNREITPAVFYAKAKFYDLNEDNVDKIYQYVQEEIAKFINFIEELYKECKAVFLTEDLMKELIHYGNANGISEKITLEFLEYYNKSNEILKKREVLELLLKRFSEVGKLDAEIDVKLETIETDRLTVEYKKAITSVMKELDKLYKSLGVEDYLSEEQEKNIVKMIESMGFLAEDMDELVLGFEKRSGFFEKRKQHHAKKVYERLNKHFEKTYMIFGKTLSYGAEYFIDDAVAQISCKAGLNYINEFEEIDFSEHAACNSIKESFKEYTQELSDDVKTLEKLLEFSLGQDERTQIDNYLQQIWGELGELEIIFEEILQNQKMSKEEREQRKASRGRWEGGGFGVGGALKGAATAGVMNATSGLLHSGVNLVGNKISDARANGNRKKAIKKFYEYTEKVISCIAEIIYLAFEKEIEENYPELDYNPDYHDNQLDGICRKNFRESENKEENAYFMLELSPYNPLNGLSILIDFAEREKMTKELQDTLGAMEKQFKWSEHFLDLCVEYEEIAAYILKEEPEDSLSNADVIDIYGEILEIKEFFGEGDGDTRKIHNQLIEKKKYVEWLDAIENATSQQIIERGNIYSRKKEFSKAKTTFDRGVKNNDNAKKIVEMFFEKHIPDELIKEVETFVQSADIGNQEAYMFISHILTGMINHEGKSLLVYAAEAHHHKLVEELIKKGADVNLLYQLIGESENPSTLSESRRICKACGKTISSTAKFCNFCGQKI